MKQFIATIAVCTLFSTLLFADGAVPRTLQEKLSGMAFLDESTTVSLDQGVMNFDGVLQTELTLTSPHSSPENTNIMEDSQLLKDKNGTGHKRSVVLLTQDQIKKELEPGLAAAIDNEIGAGNYDNYDIMANFVHHVREDAEQSFFVLLVPKSAVVEKVIYQVEWFGNGTGAHNQVRMVFNKPFVAFQQVAATYSPFTIANEDGKADIVYSLQTARLKGGKVDWSATDGLLGEYANTLQFYSVQAKAKRQVYGSYIEQFELTGMTSNQKQLVFETAQAMSFGLGDTTIYNTVFNSCVTHALLILRGLPTEAGDSYQGLSNINTMWFNPFSNVNRMKKAGVEMTKVESVNVEFSQYGAYAPAGKKILSEKDITDKQKEIKIFPLRHTLLQSAAFDNLVQKIVIYMVQEGITSVQVENFVGKVKAILAEGKDPAESEKLTTEAKSLFGKLVAAWQRVRAGVVADLQKPEKQAALAVMGISMNPEELGINEVLTALGAIKTQEFE